MTLIHRIMIAGCSAILLATCGAPEPDPKGLEAGIVELATDASHTDVDALTDAAADDLIGTWNSPTCGDRAYSRQITFRAGGAFTATDWVAPCPADAICVWSGIVNFHGTWSYSSGRVELTVEQNQLNQGFPFPEGMDFVSGELSERPECVYTREAT